MPAPFPPSPLATALLAPLGRGIEIGPAAHNSFALANCLTVDIGFNPRAAPRGAARARDPTIQPIDVIAAGEKLPFAGGSLDFVLSSHVIEHIFDAIGAIEEWVRVLRPGGLVFMIVPHHERTFDKGRPRTSFGELAERHAGRRQAPAVEPIGGHHSVWATEDLVEACRRLGLTVEHVQDVDDKVGNGFTIVLRKRRPAVRWAIRLWARLAGQRPAAAGAMPG